VICANSKESMSEMAVSQKIGAHRMGIFRPRHHPEGDHFHFSQQIFILSKEGLAGPAEEQLFARQNFLCPAMGLPYPT
jgi:hypothetical protein